MKDDDPSKKKTPLKWDGKKAVESVRRHHQQVLAGSAGPKGPGVPIGTMVEGEGIYFGEWRCAEKVFWMFANRRDVVNEAGDRAEGPYDGLEVRSQLRKTVADLGNSEDLIERLQDGSHGGEWVVPPLEVLVGRDRLGNEVQPDNLYAHKDKGALKGSFAVAVAGPGRGFSGWYWSCTENGKGSRQFFFARLSDGYVGSFLSGKERLNCRLVRFVERK